MEGAGEVGWVEDAGMESGGKLSMVFCNFCEWCKDGSGTEQLREVLDMKTEVMDFYRPDVVGLVETWSKGEEEIAVEGYSWFG